MKIIGIGEIVWDMLPTGPVLGGAPLNFAFFAKELGADAYAVSAVGEDELGDNTMKVALKSGVDLSHVQRSILPTSRVNITVDVQGVPQYEIVEGVAWDDIRCTSEALSVVSDASAICWGSLAQRSAVSRKTVMALVDAAPKECLKVFDINLRQHYYSEDVVVSSLERADVLKLNEDELPVVGNLLGMNGNSAEVILSLISRFGLRYLIYTCGALFSEVWTSDGLISHMDTPSVDVADTVGAGDSFTAAFVTMLLKGASVRDAHEKAVEVSAFVCTMPGAINPLNK